MGIDDRAVATSHGRIAIRQTNGSGMPVLLLHGNSACKEVFAHQLEALGGRYRMVAVDLPGHGQSDNASNPELTYTVPGYADAVIELTQALNLDRYAIFGWSLGGHVAIEMMSRGLDLAGAAISGTPALNKGLWSMLRGYRFTRLSRMIGKEALTRRESAVFARLVSLEPPPAFLQEAIYRSDGRARVMMMRGLQSGLGADQKRTVESCPLPLAVIDGTKDPLIRHRYIAGKVRYANLWGGQVLTIPEAGHAPFLQSPEPFNRIFDAFLSAMEKPEDIA